MSIVNSYIIDKIIYLNKTHQLTIRLIIFVSLRKFLQNRKKLKNLYAHTTVIPHFPKPRYYLLNLFTLIPIWLVVGSRKVIAKNIFSAALASRLKWLGLVNILVYDAEGAALAEKEEFGIGNGLTADQVKRLEQKAISSADLVRTVSHQMPLYWRKTLDVEQSKYQVIPCTISSNFSSISLDKIKIQAKRKELGYTSEDTIFIYAGSFSPWQGFDLIDKFFCTWLDRYPSYKLILLSDLEPDLLKVSLLFPNRIQIRFVQHMEVKDYLYISDYGLLLRDPYITNQVAAPTKFAEYLACGLKVLISPKIGDYSDFVEKYQCGYVIREAEDVSQLPALNVEERKEMQRLAYSHFTNESFSKQFETLVYI